MWEATLAVVVGFGLLVTGIWWQFGTGWALMAGGLGLMWLGWRAYRAPRAPHETA